MTTSSATQASLLLVCSRRCPPFLCTAPPPLRRRAPSGASAPPPSQRAAAPWLGARHHHRILNAGLPRNLRRWKVSSQSLIQAHAEKAVGAAAIFGLLIGLVFGGAGGGDPAAVAGAAVGASSGAAPCAAAGSATSSWGHAVVTDAEREEAALASFSPRVTSLLAGMSEAQKIGQMTQFNLDEAFADNNVFKSTPEFADTPWTLLDEDLIRTCESYLTLVTRG